MDAIVLAGGYATRLWPITKARPKMFLPLNGSTVIEPTFSELEADERIDDVYVSTNERFAGEFETYLEKSDFEKPTLSIEDTSDESEKFGVVGALAQLVDRENITEDTIVVAGDNYISFDISEYIDFFREKGSPTIAAYDVGSPDAATQYGVVNLDDANRVTKFEEKPPDPKSSLVSIACYGFPAESIRLLETYLDEDNNPDEPGWFVQWLQNRTDTYAFTFDGAWFDVGTPDSYLDAVAYELDGEAAVDPSATVTNCELGDNVQVLGNATIANASLERTVVFPGAIITGATVKNSLVDRDSTIRGVDIDGGVIGSQTVVRAPETAPETADRESLAELD